MSSYYVIPKAGLKLLSEEEAKAQAEAKARDTKAEQVILIAAAVVVPRLEIEIRKFGES